MTPKALRYLKLGVIVLLGLGSLSGHAAAPRAKDEPTRAKAVAARKEAARVLNEASSSDPEANVRAIESGLHTQEGDGPLAQAERFSKAMLLKSAQLQAQASKEINEAGWFELFDPVRLGRDPDLAGAATILANTRAAHVRYADAMHAHLDGLPQLARELVTHPVMRDMIVGNFEREGAGIRAAFDENNRYEFVALDHADELVRWLKANPDAWSVRDGKMTFASSAGQSVWDRQMAAIAKTAETQQALAEQSRRRATQKLQEEPRPIPGAGE